MDADGKNQRRRSKKAFAEWEPSWSPDGKRIAFAALEGNLDIYVMDANGRNPQNLTNNRHHDESPSWSPDGERIAFSSSRDGHLTLTVCPLNLCDGR